MLIYLYFHGFIYLIWLLNIASRSLATNVIRYLPSTFFGLSNLCYLLVIVFFVRVFFCFSSCTFDMDRILRSNLLTEFPPSFLDYLPSLTALFVELFFISVTIFSTLHFRILSQNKFMSIPSFGSSNHSSLNTL